MGNKYKHNFVKKVIVKIDFAESHKLLNSDTLIEAVADIKKRFPIAEQGIAFQQDIKLDQQGVSTEKKEFSEWVFHGISREKYLKVDELFIEIVLTKYTSQSDFMEDLIIPIAQILKINPKVAIRRTGIRFINIFENVGLTFANVNDYFADRITKQYSLNDRLTNTSRYFMVNDYMYDDIKVKEQTGFFNPDFPAIIKRHDFVLDIDAFIDTPHLINNAEAYLNQIHSIIEDHFELNIKQKLRDEVLNA